MVFDQALSRRYITLVSLKRLTHLSHKRLAPLSGKTIRGVDNTHTAFFQPLSESTRLSRSSSSGWAAGK